MENERRFAALNTKIRVLKGNLLTDEDFIHLFDKKNVVEIAQYLKESTNYDVVLKDVNIKNIHRRDLEKLLKEYIVLQHKKLLYYFTDDYRKLFETIFIRYEIEDLKLDLRNLSRKEDINELNKFVESLKETIYYPVLKSYLTEEDRRLLFYMEMNLDRLYFLLLRKYSMGLNKKDSLLFREFLGKNIDLLNLEWIYRGIKFYKLIPEELINYTIQDGHEFKYKDIKSLCYSNERQFKENVLNSKYSFLFDTKQDIDLYMERRIERYLYFQSLELLRKGKLDITVSLAYIHLLEYEVRDLFSTIEVIKYGLSFEEGKKYLIRRIEGSDDR